MSLALLIALVLGTGLGLAVTVARRRELRSMRVGLESRERAKQTGAAQALLQHPVVDLSRCLGCGTCVAACPEEGVLEMLHGQAAVIRGGRCVGHAACETECPTGAVTVTLGNLAERDDVPAITEQFEAKGQHGLFLAGEVTAHALIKTAIEHGKLVAGEVARRAELDGPAPEGVTELLIVGAGPAGLACALAAKECGVQAVLLDQEAELGGTVARYPRAKLVLTQPVQMPLYGKLRETTYTKEELMERWHTMAREQELAFEGGHTFEQLERLTDGTFLVKTSRGKLRARSVCLAIGRRGTPRKLGVPGEELPHVAYDLVDAQAFRNQPILVVGGGDSAVEAALGLAEQPGNRVTLAYRREAFFRLRAQNELRIEQARKSGRIDVRFATEVDEIRADSVQLTGATETEELPCSAVFVQAGGIAPTERLRQAGVSFDHESTDAGTQEAGTGLLRALAIGFTLSLGALAFVLWHRDYYLLDQAARPAHEKHDLLRPGLGIGLGLGLASLALIGANLLYLARRYGKIGFTFGSLSAWMTLHVATGVLAFLFAALHAALGPRDTVGGRAFWLMAILIATGAIGRYLYSFVPRAANGRELALSEARARLERLSSAWDRTHTSFAEKAREEMNAMIERRQWRGHFVGRLGALFGAQHDLARVTRNLDRRAREEGLADDQRHETLRLVRGAHRAALMAAHYEDLRAVMSTWRWIHRWGALLLLALVGLHVAYALSYGAHLFEEPSFRVPEPESPITESAPVEAGTRVLPAAEPAP